MNFNKEMCNIMNKFAEIEKKKDIQHNNTIKIAQYYNNLYEFQHSQGIVPNKCDCVKFYKCTNYKCPCKGRSKCLQCDCNYEFQQYIECIKL